MDLSIQKNIALLLHQLNRLSIVEFLTFISSTYPGEIVFSSSFSYEDQVITHRSEEPRLNSSHVKRSRMPSSA